MTHQRSLVNKPYTADVKGGLDYVTTWPVNKLNPKPQDRLIDRLLAPARLWVTSPLRISGSLASL